MCSQNKADILRILLDDSRLDPGMNDNSALVYAVQRGHENIIDMLISDPRVDPSARNNMIIKLACQYCSEKIVKNSF